MSSNMVQVACRAADPFAIAIIYQNNKYLLQLRNNIPTIVYPRCWGLFGGHIEEGKTPEKALVREIKEEIDYDVVNFSKFGNYEDNKVIRHVFQFPLNVDISQLTLKDGWDFALVSADDIRKGKIYSHKANQIQPLGDIHHKILLDYVRLFE